MRLCQLSVQWKGRNLQTVQRRSTVLKDGHARCGDGSSTVNDSLTTTCCKHTILGMALKASPIENIWQIALTHRTADTPLDVGNAFKYSSLVAHWGTIYLWKDIICDCKYNYFLCVCLVSIFFVKLWRKKSNAIWFWHVYTSDRKLQLLFRHNVCICS